MKSPKAFRLTSLFSGGTLILLGAALAAASIVTSVGVNRIVQSAQRTELEAQLDAIRNTFRTEARGAEMMATLVAGIPSISAAMAQGDRQALLHELQPAFKHLKGAYGVKQFQFHTPPATSMLRIHKPEKYGDDLALFRKTVVETNARRQTIGGLEKGVAGLGIRGVAPVFHDRRHIGSVEFGFAVNAAIEALRGTSRLRARIYIMDDDTPRQVGATQDDLPHGLSGEDLKKAFWGKPLYKAIDTDDGTRGTLAASLSDFSGKPIGVIEVFSSNDRIAGMAQDLSRELAVIAITMMLFGALFSYRLSRGVSATLSAAARAFRNLTTGNATSKLERPALASRIVEATQLLDDVEHLQTHLGAILAEDNDSREPLPISLAEDLRAAAHETALITERQSTELERLSSQTDAIGATIERLSPRTSHTIAPSDEVASQVEEGLQKASQAHQAVARLADEIKGIQEAIQGLKGNADSISQVLAFIATVTEQTNLLALNAAIESARAGEAGRGFAVVADEVRTLALRTQEATVDIEKRINALHNGVDTASAEIDAIQENALQGIGRVEETHAFIQTMTDRLAQAGDPEQQNAQQADDRLTAVQTIATQLRHLAGSARKARELSEHVHEIAEEMANQNS